MEQERHNHPVHNHRMDKIKDPLYVITPIINTPRSRARWKNYALWEKHILDGGAHLILIEAAFGQRDHVFVERRGEKHHIIHVRTPHELWIKENLINTAIHHLCTFIDPNAKYIACIDADIMFIRQDWVGECLQQLQHTPVLQMFSEIIYMTPNSEKHSEGLSFMEGWRRGINLHHKGQRINDKTFYKRKNHKNPKDLNHYDTQVKGWCGGPGAAWAYRREALDQLGGLLEFAILGSADTYMAYGLFGMVDLAIHPKFHPEYIQWIKDWEDNAVREINRNVGHMKGCVHHLWHGKLTNRQYGSRNDILIKHQYNPRLDVKKSTQGLLQLQPLKWQLRDDIRSYNEIRNDDSTDL